MKKIIGLVFLILTSCVSELKKTAKPSNLIPKDSIIMVLKDLTILESHVRIKNPAVQQSYKTIKKSSQLIFNKYHIDSSRFTKSMNYYFSRQKEMEGIYSQILDSVNREITELSAK